MKVNSHANELHYCLKGSELFLALISRLKATGKSLYSE